MNVVIEKVINVLLVKINSKDIKEKLLEKVMILFEYKLY